MYYCVVYRTSVLIGAVGVSSSELINPIHLHGVDPVEALPISPVEQACALSVVGVHGGAGESFLASLGEDWQAAGHAWRPHVSGQPTVLCARTHASGLAAMSRALRQWAGGIDGISLVGCVFIADAPGRLPKGLANQLTVMRGGSDRSWLIGWIEALRVGNPLSRYPNDVRQFMNDVIATTSKG